MKERTRSTIAVAAWVVIFMLGGIIDAHAMSDKSRFENTYSYQVRNICRDIGTTYGYGYAIQCANRVLENQRREELRISTLELMRSETELNDQITKDLKRR